MVVATKYVPQLRYWTTGQGLGFTFLVILSADVDVGWNLVPILFKLVMFRFPHRNC